jgi:kumamolisin
MEKRGEYMRGNFLKRAGLKLFLGIFLSALGMAMASNSLADPFYSYVRNNADGSQTLTGHVPRDIRRSAFKYHASLNISAQIIMPLANQSQLSALLQGLYDPKSPNFHHFLTPAQFAQQFSSPAIDSAAVQEYFKKEGISVTGQSPNGAVLFVTGPVGAFEQAFGMHINYYQRNDNKMFFAPDADPTVPAILAGKILAVGGLDNLPKYMAHRQQYPMKALPKAAGSGPGGFLAPSDVKTAYNLNSVTATGSGQSVALFELDGYSSSDITAYETHFGLSSVPLQNILIDGFSGVPNYSDGGADEVTLDIELVAAFAPGSSNIFVYEAPNTTQSWIDEWTQIAADDKAKVISCSWGEPEMDSPTINFDNAIFQEMAAQGQAVFVAAGDNGAYDAGGNSILAVDEPASQPYATAVGISKLTTNSNGTYNSETASVYGGGGVSAYWSIPAYQTTLASQAVAAAKVSTTMRNLPDVVLTADASTAYAFYIDGAWWGYFGSSLASPIWASFISRVNQGLGSNAPIGSVNTVLYQLAQTSSYANDFHDITTGNNGYYPAEPGFDDAAGLGSFNGLNLYNDLVKTSVAVTAPSAPTGLSAIAGNTAIALSWTASSGAVSYDLKRSTVNGGPYTTIATSIINTTFSDNSVSNDTIYYYVVSAVNSGGQSSNSSQASATYAVLPTVSLATNGTSFTAAASITLTATASETNGTISKVLFYNGSTLLSTVTSSPFAYTWSNVPVGNYSLTAQAFDSNNNSTTSAPVTITVNPQPSLPTVSLTAPSNNASFSFPQSVFLSANASEANGTIAQVQFFNGSTLLYTATSAPYNYTWTANLLYGSYTLTAQAIDSRGVVVTSAPVTITFNLSTRLGTNPSTPQVAITSPGNAGSIAAGSNLSITASASETNGTIAEVYFYNGSSFLGSSNASPYSYTWTNVPVGSYTLTAKAVDTTGHSVISNPITVTAVSVTPVSPVIITNPANQTVTAPATATFTVAASGTPAPAYQWMQSVNGGAYTAISAATGAAYTTPATTVSQSGTQFKCVVTNSAGTATSNAATLTVYTVPSITVQPVSQTVTAPAAATFTVAAGGTPAPAYQWMQSVNGGTYTAINAATSASYTTAATTIANNGTQFECVVTNTAGSVTSSAASLTVNPAPVAPSITAQPSSVTVTAPAAATFSVTASGTPAPTYQWMQSVNGGAFTNISGATGASYTTSATTIGNSATQFECVVTNSSGTVTSNSATLTVYAMPSITTQPVSQTVTAPATATFTVAATGTPAPSFQWTQSVNGGTFTNISGATNPFYTTAATTIANSGTQFKCVITNAAGSVTSSAAILTVNPAPVAPSITTQPVNQTVTAPAAATFSVAATGTPAPTYQWMESANGGAYTAINGATGAAYTTPATIASESGTQFECVVTNSSGTVTSNAATLTVNPAVAQSSLPVVSLTAPSNNSVVALLSSITISAAASEVNGTITQVQFYNGTTLLYTATSSPYTFNWKPNLLPGSYTITARAIDSNGVVVTSAPVTITISLSGIGSKF